MSIEKAIQDNTAALNNLAALIQKLVDSGVSTGPATAAADVAPKTTSKAKTEDTSAADEGPFFWANLKKGTQGQIDTKAEFEKLKKKDKDLILVTETKYKALVAAAEESSEEGGSDAPALTKDQLAKIAQAFLPKELPKEERPARLDFIKALLERFGEGAAKLTEIPEANFGIVGNLIERKNAGQDVDPESDGYEALEEESEDSMI